VGSGREAGRLTSRPAKRWRSGKRWRLAKCALAFDPCSRGARRRRSFENFRADPAIASRGVEKGASFALHVAGASRWLAVLGSALFCVQTALLDAVVWPVYFPY